MFPTLSEFFFASPRSAARSITAARVGTGVCAHALALDATPDAGDMNDAPGARTAVTMASSKKAIASSMRTMQVAMGRSRCRRRPKCTISHSKGGIFMLKNLSDSRRTQFPHSRVFLAMVLRLTMLPKGRGPKKLCHSTVHDCSYPVKEAMDVCLVAGLAASHPRRDGQNHPRQNQGRWCSPDDTHCSQTARDVDVRDRMPPPTSRCLCTQTPTPP